VANWKTSEKKEKKCGSPDERPSNPSTEENEPLGERGDHLSHRKKKSFPRLK